MATSERKRSTSASSAILPESAARLPTPGIDATADGPPTGIDADADAPTSGIRAAADVPPTGIRATTDADGVEGWCSGRGTSLLGVGVGLRWTAEAEGDLAGDSEAAGRGAECAASVVNT